MADLIRDVVIKLTIEQTKVSLKVPDVKPVVAAQAAIQKAALAAAKAQEDHKKAQQEAAAAAAESASKISDSSLKTLEGLRTLGDGAFTAMRGVALAYAANEEEAAKMIKTIAGVQAGFDVFKGIVDVGKGVTETYRAMRATSTLVATAETARAVAHGAAATGARTAAVANVSLLATMGPIALAALAVGAAVAVMYAAWAKGAKEAADLKKNVKGLTEGFREASAGVGETIQELVRFRLDGVVDDIGAVNKGFAELRAETEKAFAAQRKAASIFAPFGVSDESQKKMAQIEVDRRRALKDLDIERLRALEAVNAAQQTSLDKAQQEVNAKKDALALERQRNQTIQERIGALDAGDVRRLKSIAERKERGEDLSLDDARFLQSTGVGQKVAGGVFAEAGRRQGGEGIANVLEGTGEAERAGAGEWRAAQKALDSLKAKPKVDVAQQQQEVVDAFEQLAKAREDQAAVFLRILLSVKRAVSLEEELRRRMEANLGIVNIKAAMKDSAKRR